MVFPAEVLHLPKPDPLPEPGEPLTTYAYISSAFLGNWREVTRGMQDVTLAKDTSVVIFEPRPDWQLRYFGWTEADEERLGIPDEAA